MKGVVSRWGKVREIWARLGRQPRMGGLCTGNMHYDGRSTNTAQNSEHLSHAKNWFWVEKDWDLKCISVESFPTFASPAHSRVMHASSVGDGRPFETTAGGYQHTKGPSAAGKPIKLAVTELMQPTAEAILFRSKWLSSYPLRKSPSQLDGVHSSIEGLPGARSKQPGSKAEHQGLFWKVFVRRHGRAAWCSCRGAGPNHGFTEQGVSRRPSAYCTAINEGLSAALLKTLAYPTAA